jgi:hypothetical protein
VLVDAGDKSLPICSAGAVIPGVGSGGGEESDAKGAGSAGDRALRATAWALCLIAGIAVGVSGFNSVSNHPTYLPPGLRYLHPSFLAGDWWLNSSHQYHFAFFALTAALARLGILEVGLAVLNILAVAGGLYAGFRIIVWLRAERPLACLALLVSAFLATSTFFSIGNTFLFMQSLQPSSIAAAATLAALLAFLERRPIRCGLWLGLAGLFHINYLVANVPLFGLAYVLKAVLDGDPRRLLSKRSLVELLQMFGPSLVLVAMFLPVLLTVEGDALSPAAAAEADWIFFRFAVPFHYYPLGWLRKLPVLLGWQVLGLLWTVRAVPDPSQRRAMWAIQLAFGLVLWSAIALTTLVFIAPVSRLLLWRLAPFAVFLSALLTIVGAVRLLSRGRDARAQSAWDSRVLLASVLIPILLMPFAPRPGEIQPTGYPGPMVLAPLFVLVWARLFSNIVLPWNKYIAGPVLLILIALAAYTLPVVDERSRYSMLTPETPDARDEDALFAFARQSTPIDAQFLIPPTLDMFRLLAERAIVVDFKAMPVDRTGLIEWYRRLAALSGEPHPATMKAVYRGYERLDPARLEDLRRRYRLTHMVLFTSQKLSPHGWSEIYRNPTFRLLAYRGR